MEYASKTRTDFSNSRSIQRRRQGWENRNLEWLHSRNRILTKACHNRFKQSHDLSRTAQTAGETEGTKIWLIRRLSWPLHDDVNDSDLMLLLYPAEPAALDRPKPDCEYISMELKRKGVTLC